MKTDDLIASLALEADRPRGLHRTRGALLCLCALAVPVVYFVNWMGMRSDWPQVLGAPVTLLKQGIPLALTLVAGAGALRLMRPAQARALSLWPLAVVAAIAATLWLWALLRTPEAALGAAFSGQTLAKCLTAVPVFALFPLVTGVAVLRRGASTRPMLSGALLGLACGAAAATGYALHCTEDNPLFFITWYGAGIAVSTALGTLAGRFFLRW
ncbi:hypothetical protein AQS8620_01737 [Aquimixticola soesokkakensis]|uniref:Anti-sigma-F factor NrsF n=1 Tax=Aquimixticola soesokkakensis TaxID=1519096 RepID=A0A1Y5SMD4_9RHOB|nr:DUF1109 domain-containing protein [Aquimixticola soesokkakensis]SLN43697.1 hypothetical protein AQS8620_01737 [Aquimixticola soesokkakensis]